MKTTNKAALASVISVLALCSAQPAFAQDTAAAGDAADPDQSGDGDISEIVVLAQRLRGTVESAQPPILVLDEEEIAAYGAGSIAELVEQLAPETGSGRGRGTGRPVFLVNGLRVSSFREMRSYPPEAIRRVEVLPEETALKYGFSADQRIINFILKDNFSSREVELEYGQPDRGGYSTKEAEGTYLRIAGPSRLNLNLDVQDTSLLTEAERGVIQSPGSISDVAGDPDPAAFRSLVPDGTDLEATANWTTKLGEGGSSLSLNGTVERADSRSLSGLNRVLLTDPAGETALRTFGADDPLERRSRSETYSLGSTLNAPLGNWQLTGTLDAAHGKSRTEIDRYADTSGLVAAAAAGTLQINGDLPVLPDPGFDEARSDTNTLDSLVTVMGSPFYLPAGDVSVTVDGGFKWNRIQSQDTRNPGLETDISRSRFSGGFNLGVPIASRRDDDAWAWLGDFDLNFSGGIDQLSDFGTLTNWTAGFVWGVTDKLSLQASYITSDQAPSLSELGSPEVVTLNVPVYDFSRGETVLVSTTGGGNPNLLKEKQRDIRLAAMWDLPFLERSNLSVEYFRNRSSDVSASFPLLTPAIESAFPGRVTRDANGQLLSIDQRPITIAQQNSSRLKFGLNLSGRIGGSSQEGGSRGGGLRAAAREAAAPEPAPPTTAPESGNTGASRFAEMRQRLCASEGETPPDISQLPQRMQERLRGPDGKVDPERYAQMRSRMCSADGQAARPAFDPERFEAIRQALCTDGKEPDLSVLPEEVLARLRGPDGQIDQDRLARLKQRICSPEAESFARERAGQAATPQREGAAPDGPPPASADRGGGRGPGGFMGGGGARGNGRWSLNLSYTLELDNTALIAPGLPELDLLAGDALSGGSTPRHSAELEGGVFYKGFGFRLSGTYSGPSDVNGSGLPGASDLHFGSLAKFDLRIFADLGRQESLVEKAPFFKGSRISLKVDNLFDARRTITDQNGEVPLSYQPFLLDPTGRFIGVELRKMF